MEVILNCPGKHSQVWPLLAPFYSGSRASQKPSCPGSMVFAHPVLLHLAQEVPSPWTDGLGSALFPPFLLSPCLGLQGRPLLAGSKLESSVPRDLAPVTALSRLV